MPTLTSHCRCGTESTAPNRACPKCAAIKKSGKFSCCARGGAWFKNCGMFVTKNVDHTWVEGVQACRGFSGSSSGAKLRSQVILHHEKTQSQQNVTRDRSGTQQHIPHSIDDDMSDADTTDCEGCHSLAKIILFDSISILFLLL